MRKQWLLTCLVLIGFVLPLAAQQRGSDDGGGAREVVDARDVAKIGRQWAVFIAIEKYREWGPLHTPVRDAKEIRDILWGQYYIDEVRELYDEAATYMGIRELLVSLRSQVSTDDSVFVFYAGHGQTDPETNIGYWIPVDGQRKEAGQANWMPNQMIRQLITELPAKHVFLVSDSCFSGDILDNSRGASPQIDSNYYRRAYAIPSRQVMTSGASETVPEPSEFALRLKNALRYAEDACFDPDYLFTKAEVRNVQLTRPLLGAIRNTGFQGGGSFLFFRRPTIFIDPLPETTNTAVIPPPVIQPGEEGYFTGSWIADMEYNGSFDTYLITLSANGRCTVKMINDTARQETAGNWSWDGTYFRLNAVFRNPSITYQRNIQWVSIVSFSGNNAFNILARAAADDSRSQKRFTFFRE